MKVLTVKHKQRGDVLLLSLFMLLMMTLGLFAAMRTVKNDTQTSGALSWHTRGKQASEVVLKQTLTDIASATGSVSLSASSPVWFRVGSNPNYPDQVFWANCVGNVNTASRCEKVVSDGFSIFRVVQEAAAVAAGSGSSCYPVQAKYYHIFIHAVERSAVGSQVDTEAVYRLCL